MDLGWNAGDSGTFDLDARGFDFQPILVALNTDLADDPEFEAGISGAAHLKYRMGALSRLSGKLVLDSYLLRRKGYSLALAKSVRFEIQNGNYEFEGLRLVSENAELV